MATYYSGYSNTYRLVLELTESLPSGYIADNETTVNFTLKVSCGASYAQWNPGPGDFTVAINGSTVFSSNNPKFWFTGANQTITIGSGSVSVPHNSDGTKTVSFSANYKAESTASYLPNSMSLSGSMTLTTIPRASSISSITNDGMTINGSNALTVNISRASSSFTHDVTFTFGSYSQKLTGQGTSAALTIPLSWIGRFGNGGKGSLTGTVTVQTKSGTTNIGSAVSKGFTLYCPNASSISSATESIVCNGSNSIAVNISRSISSFTHTVKWTFGSYTNSKTGQGTSSSYAPPTSWLAAISAANSGTGSVSVTTYYGSQQIGATVSKNFTMSVPDYTPSLTSVTAALVQDTKISDWNIYVQNHSKVKFTFNGAAGAYSSTIKEYKVVLDGVTYKGTATSYTSNLLTNKGSLSWTATITDSRGKTNSKSGTISVSEKIAPSYVSAIIGRYEDGKFTDEGTEIYFKFVYDYETYNGLNSTVNKLSYRNVKDSYYMEYGSFENDEVIVIDEVVFEDKESYELLIEVTDELGSKLERKIIIPTANALIDADGPNNALGLLRMASKANTVQVGGALEIDGKMAVEPIGSVVGYQRFDNDWIGLYPTHADAIDGTNRKGWIGHNDTDDLHIKNEKNGYIKFVTAGKVLGIAADSEGYVGFSGEGGYVRTPTNGLLPNASGANSTIGTSDWRFSNGYFKGLDVSGYTRLANQQNAIGMMRFVDQWIGFYPTPNDADNGTNRKLYMGFGTTNNTTFDFSNNIANATTGYCFAWQNGGAYIYMDVGPDGYEGFSTSQGWIRTPGNGLLPYKQGGASNLGSSYWPFTNAYINNMYVGSSITVAGMPLISSTTDSTRITRLRMIKGSSNYVEVATASIGNWGVTAWSSDKSLKKNIKDTEIRHALDKISQLKHVEFDWKNDDGHVPLGYIADDIEKVLPCLTFEVEQRDEDGNVTGSIRHINHTTLIPLITMGMQELIEEKDLLWDFDNLIVDEFITLQDKVNNLEKQIEELKALI